MRVLGLIPARGGSKGIPHKNLALLSGKPLLAYTCAAALGCRTLDRVIVSTDDPAIADVARTCGIAVPFLRPAALAEDATPMIDVVRHVLEVLGAQGYRPDAVALLQPTSPLRRSEHIDAAVERLASSSADTVVSVIAVPHQFSPASVMTLTGDRLVPYENGPSVLRRQDKPAVFARNGPAVLVVRTAALLTGGFYDGVVHGLEMSWAESIDVDTPADLQLAEFWMTRKEAE